MIFTWSAPWRICSRADLRTSSTPWATADLNCRPLQQTHSPPRLVRRRESECPPVGPMDWPAMNSLGPVICSVSIAVLMPQSAPPVSRTVVKPRSSMARNRVAARAVTSVIGIASRKRTLTSLWMACTWQSISPGINVRWPQSMTLAPAALIGVSLNSLTVSPSISSSYPPRSSPNDGSSKSKFLNRICWDIGGSVQPVLVKAPALHDDREVSAFFLKQLQVLERIAVDDEQIGERARLQAAELALHADDLGADRGGRTDDLGRRQHLGAKRELVRLRDLQLSEQVGAVGDRDTVTLADVERLQGAVDDEVVLGQHVRTHAV